PPHPLHCQTVADRVYHRLGSKGLPKPLGRLLLLPRLRIDRLAQIQSQFPPDHLRALLQLLRVVASSLVEFPAHIDVLRTLPGKPEGHFVSPPLPFPSHPTAMIEPLQRIGALSRRAANHRPPVRERPPAHPQRVSDVRQIPAALFQTFPQIL